MGKKKPVPVKEVSPVSSLDAVKDKFKRLREVRAKLEGVKSLYIEHDELVKELLPLFLTADKDGSILITREIKIGATTYRFNPSFLDDGDVKVKSWRSVAFPIGVIE